MSSPDISSIINLIMQNPDLIEQISSLAKNAKADENDTEQTQEEIKATEPVIVTSQPVVDNKGEMRNRLLGAMKPYLSDARSQAIDQMISIASILDMMKKG